DAFVIASPGVGIGGIAIRAPSQFWGTELNYRGNLWRGCHTRLDYLAGFRYLELKEGLDIFTASQLLVDGGNQALTPDKFDTFNQFFGGQLGLLWECRGPRWSLDLRAKLAVGDSYQSVNIQGNTFVPGLGLFTGGLFAQPSNIGRSHENQFAVVPELGINIG